MGILFLKFLLISSWDKLMIKETCDTFSLMSSLIFLSANYGYIHTYLKICIKNRINYLKKEAGEITNKMKS